MKKILLLFLSAVITVTALNAQNVAKNGMVTLKNGTAIEGAVKHQGSDVVVTTAAGDVFVFLSSEISKISLLEENEKTGKTKDNKYYDKYIKKYDKHLARQEEKQLALGYKQFRHDVKTVYHGAGKFDESIEEFWNENYEARFYYEKHRKLKTAAWLTGYVAIPSLTVGIVLASVEGEKHNYPYETGGIVCCFTGLACFVPFFTTLICSNSNFKKSYRCYAKDGKNHALNVSASPVFYAQGGTGVGITINF